MSGRLEHKLESEERMKHTLAEEPEYVTGFYRSLLNGHEYLTAQNYTKTALRFLNYINYDLNDFTANKVDDFLLSLKGRKGECSDSFKNTTRYALSSFGKYLKRSKILQENPVEDTEKLPMRDCPEKVSMTSDELNLILQRIKENTLGTPSERGRRKNWIERNYAIFSILITTGMRVNALVEIDVNDFNPDKGTLIVIEKRRKYMTYELEESTINAIKDWLTVRESYIGDFPCEAMFISNQKRRMTAKSVRDLVKIYTVGIDKHITPHKFRSTFVTTIYEETGNIYLASQAVGHGNVGTTQRYIATKDSSKKAAEIIRKKLE